MLRPPSSVLGTAPWRRAPLLLRRSPAVLLAVLAAGLILGAAAAATPLFLSSAANAALARQVDVAAMGSRGRRRVRRRLVGYVFQQPGDNLLPYLTTREQLELAAQLRGRQDAQEVERLLAALGLEHRAGHRPEQLSGGEQQRLAFAAAVVGGPALVVADEPTAELDTEAGERLMQAVLGLRDQGTSLVISSHDPVVTGAVDQVVRLHDGEVS